MRPSSTPPNAVRRCAQLMAGCVVLAGAGAVLAVAAMRHLDAASAGYLNVVDAIDRPSAVTRVADLRSGLATHIVVGILGVLLLGPLALAVRRPSRAARAVAWVAALALAVGLVFVIPTGLQSLASADPTDTPDVAAAVTNLLADWYPDLTTVLVAAQLAAMVAFSLLLMRTSASEFYARPNQDGPAGLWTFAARG